MRRNKRTIGKLIYDSLLAFIQYLFCRTSFDPYELGILIYGPSSVCLQVLRFNTAIKERTEELKSRLHELSIAAKRAKGEIVAFDKSMHKLRKTRNRLNRHYTGP